MPEAIVNELDRFFRETATSMLDVLDAASCREGWIHGELYRWAKHNPALQGLQVNCKIGTRTVDFTVPTSPETIGELKIIGSGYEPKCITGGALKPLTSRLSSAITAADGHLTLGPWGLIPDFFRLLDFAKTQRAVAYLVLIADMRPFLKRTLEQSLTAINFIAPSHDIDLVNGIKVRIWKIS